jgi:hypothetical protein
MQAHIVGVQDDAPGAMPQVLAQVQGGVRAIALVDAFDWRLSGDRHCIGQWIDGKHVPCPTMELVTQDHVCRACSGLEHPECVFEPLCQNDPKACLCLATFAGVEHVVYLAFHGILPKVGLTQAWRVERRLREQGADAYFVLQRGLDRPTARLVEKQVSFRHNVPEFRTHKQTFAALTRPVAWEAIHERAAAWREKLAADFEPGPTQTIERTALPVPLPSTPRLLQAYGHHAGRWLGAKGNHLFYAQRPGPHQLSTGMAVAALRRSDLLGRALVIGPADEPSRSAQRD